jgi:hypothetical protein
LPKLHIYKRGRRIFIRGGPSPKRKKNRTNRSPKNPKRKSQRISGPEIVVNEHAHEFLNKYGIYAISVGWANNGDTEIDVWAEAITPELHAKVPPKLGGFPVVVFATGPNSGFRFIPDEFR